MSAHTLLLTLTVVFALLPGVARAHRSALPGVAVVHPGPVFVAPGRSFVVLPGSVFVAPFRVHPHGFRHFAFVAVAPFPGAVFVDPFWWWNGGTWVWIPGHWVW